MAKLKPVQGRVYLTFECSDCKHRYQKPLKINERMELMCPECLQMDESVAVNDFRLVYEDEVVKQPQLSKTIQDKVVGRLKKLGFYNAQQLVELAIAKRPATEQELTKLALAEVEIPDER